MIRRQTILEFCAYSNGIAWYSPDMRMLQWFKNWNDAMQVIGSLMPTCIIKITGSDSIYLPR